MCATKRLLEIADALANPDPVQRRTSLRGECVSSRELRALATSIAEDFDALDASVCADCERFWLRSELGSLFDGGEKLCPSCLAVAAQEAAEIKSTQTFLHKEMR